MVSSNAEKVLFDLWQMYGNSIENLAKSNINNNENLIEEFFFIILGGFGISYELNLSALKVLKNKMFLDRKLYKNKEVLTNTIELLKNEFNTKQFQAQTNSNELRKYRFIETKSHNVALAGNWLWNECEWNIFERLKTVNNSREWLCNCPGIGMKSASWFLRNVGYSDNYAVLDVHILRFVSKLGIEVPNTLSKNAYIHIEESLRNLCENIGVTLGEMDFLLWNLGRCGYLEHVRCI